MASPFDLVSLADLKSWLALTGTNDDVLLAQLITQISRAIFNVIDRPAILPSAYTETYDGGNEVSIMLRQWPAAERYAYRSRIGQHSKSLGGQETIAFIVKDVPDFVASALSPYRRVVMP